MATVTQESPGWDVPQVAEEARFVDANGRSVTLLDIYRADFGDGSEGHGLMADARAQIERTGSGGTPRPIAVASCRLPGVVARSHAHGTGGEPLNGQHQPLSADRPGRCLVKLGDRRGYRDLIMWRGRLRRKPPGIAETVRK